VPIDFKADLAADLNRHARYGERQLFRSNTSVRADTASALPARLSRSMMDR